MTDLQRLITLAEATANTAWDDHPMRCDPNWQMHAETARILALLLRVREGAEITIKKSPQFKHRIEIHASWDTLRELTELLENRNDHKN